MESEEKSKDRNVFRSWDFKELRGRVEGLCFEDVVRYMYQPTDPSSLGIIRFLFGLLMLVDLPEERGGADVDIRWGDPRDCHFPLFSILETPSYALISLLYLLMFIGACGIMLGYKYRLSVFLFGVPYWYLLLLDKSYWNNHSYLFGVVTILLMGSSANHFFSLDGYFDESKRNKHVPYWNYFILKFQFFMLYFLAGLKKTDMEWLEGYSMTNLGRHWVFLPFQLILSSDQIDYLIVHWFGFLLDLTIGFWMLMEFTRPVAMLFCACFHLMNSRLFSIGMFPYVCLATMPLFCAETWPRKIQSLFTKSNLEPSPSDACIYPDSKTDERKDSPLQKNAKWKHKLVVSLLICHCGLQTFLPYSHFITKGYNNWTNGLYGYSWDMMVHSWNTILVLVKVVDNNSGNEYFVDSQAWTLNERWNKHADMCVQYAQCLKTNLLQENGECSQLMSSPGSKDVSNYITSDNISVYIDLWCSLNNRFQQRMYDPNYDLLKANWSPFRSVEWLMPILTEYNDFRVKMNEISEEVYAWSNQSEVLFIADFPGLYLENFIKPDLTNVTLTVLEGEVVYEIEDPMTYQSLGVRLAKGESVPVEVGIFHKVHTVSKVPSCYMYTFIEVENSEEEESTGTQYGMYSPFPLIENVQEWTESFSRMWKHIGSSVLYLLFGRPYEVRTRIKKGK